MQIVTESDMPLRAPCPQPAGLCKESFGDSQVRGASQFQWRAAGFVQELHRVGHDLRRVGRILDTIEVEAAAQFLRRTGPVCDDQIKFESTVDIEDPATIFERQAPTQGSFLKIQAANAGGALVGMEGRGHQHADGTIRTLKSILRSANKRNKVEVSRVVWLPARTR